jgi:signal transduction histidine kinase
LLTDVSRSLRTALAYLGCIITGCALALLADYTAAPDNVYVMFAVLFVVAAALTAGTGPAVAVAITAVIGDDLVLSGRLPPLDQWRDELVFGTIAITVGLVVAAKRKQQLAAERLAARERMLRTERDAILAAISHDVKNPLAVIIASARRGLGAAASPDVSRQFARIDSAAAQASHLIDELVDLRSVDGTNSVELDLRPRDLRSTLEAAVDQMRAVSRGHRLRYIAPADDAPVVSMYDEPRVQRVFQNLIGNAIKYSPDGGDINIELRVQGETAGVTVRDHGMGIPPDEQARIFEPGYRARGARGIPGSGLGLFISAEIVGRHGGTITCGAADGGGTSFEVRLPLVGFCAPPERLEQLETDRSGHSAANRPVVDRDDRHELARRAREERLVRAK